MSDEEGRARWLGAALIGAGLVLNEWVVAWLVTSDGTIDNPVTRVGIWVFDLFALTGGFSLWRSRRMPKARSVVAGLAAVAVGLLGLELALHLLEGAGRRADEQIDPRALLSPYDGAPWARELYEELGPRRGTENNFRYHMHLGWALKSYAGKFVQIDDRGIRRTWNPPDLPDAAPSLYLLGGSTVWGTGVRDDYTLPSQLSRSLAERGHPFEVHNYGQLAYTFPQNQDILNLMFLLKAGHRPDYVVFYNGVNDVYGAYVNGAPGGTLDRETLVMRNLSSSDHLKIGVTGFLEENSRLYSGLLSWLASPVPSPDPGASMTPAELRELARDVIDDYESWRRILDGLARGFGFEYVTLWQPVTFTESELRDEERSDPRVDDEALGNLHRFALEELRSRDLDRFYDLSDALRGREQTFYIDYRHLSEDGNAVIADRIADILLRSGEERHDAPVGAPR